MDEVVGHRYAISGYGWHLDPSNSPNKIELS